MRWTIASICAVVLLIGVWLGVVSRQKPMELERVTAVQKTDDTPGPFSIGRKTPAPAKRSKSQVQRAVKNATAQDIVIGGAPGGWLMVNKDGAVIVFRKPCGGGYTEAEGTDFGRCPGTELLAHAPETGGDSGSGGGDGGAGAGVGAGAAGGDAGCR